MPKTLREQLVGAWKLVSYVEKPVDGSDPFYPMGEEPQGIIMYTPDGYMSAQLMRPGRPKFASGDWFRGSPEEIKEEASGYIAYSQTSLKFGPRVKISRKFNSFTSGFPRLNLRGGL
jgi:Lipocalin-like domain